ncbi:hypothetical protein [Nostoc sp. CMAA1605]|uniref:hypothetical protein n=1 Tax=Nostoc sp. CMAA1605 TaxID=2055159 RepID=UPI001F250E72|nr:hypothetical protein [Nostoc sp. CMAA1605]
MQSPRGKTGEEIYPLSLAENRYPQPKKTLKKVIPVFLLADGEIGRSREKTAHNVI